MYVGLAVSNIGNRRSQLYILCRVRERLSGAFLCPATDRALQTAHSRRTSYDT